jgi:hypothetical protein
LGILADKIPLSDLPDILDSVNPPKEPDEIDPTNALYRTKSVRFELRRREVGSFYERVLTRAWRLSSPFDVGRGLSWLQKRRDFGGGYGGRDAADLRAALRETPDRVTAIADHFLTSVPIDDARWLSWHRFREAILFELSSDMLLDLVVEYLRSAKDDDRQQFLYEIAHSLCYQAVQPHAGRVFEWLYALAELRPSLRETREQAVVLNLPANYFRGRSSRHVVAEDSCEQQRRAFDAQASQILSGMHLGWMQHIAQIYFAFYRDLDSKMTPRERLVAWFGEERVETALAGLRATPLRSDIPTFDDVMKLIADHEHFDWWYALVAGLNERWSNGEGVNGLSEDFLKAMLAFDITDRVSFYDGEASTWRAYPWRSALVQTHPEIVKDVYLTVARLRLSRGEQIIDGLHELCHDDKLELFRSDIVLELLRDFPNASPWTLGELLDAVMNLPATHSGFVQLAASVLTDSSPADERQRDLWLAAAYILAPDRWESAVEARAAQNPGIVFDLRDRSGFAPFGRATVVLPLQAMEFLARVTGSLFSETLPPEGDRGGNTNAWDASEYFRRLTNSMSVLPNEAATDALVRLEANPQLTSYRSQMLYVLASQRQRQRDAKYDRPDWPQTVTALENGAPATVADLHALLVAHLKDLKEHIERDNTDIYKRFWNLDSFSKPVEPRPEEACRDDLVTMMRPLLSPKGIIIEPEGHMARDKRADISVAMPGRKVLCELKRNYHAEVWTAIEEQLERFYAHDPEAKGYGVFCVFWFRDKRARSMPNPPNGLSPPKSAAEMEQMLKILIPENMKNRLAAIVIDVSGEV